VTLDVLSGRYWGDILLGHESQDRNFALADAVAAVTQEQVVDYYRQHIANPQAGRLVMRSVGMGHQQQFRAAGSESAGTVQIGTDAPELEMFKNSRPVFAYP
jgi:secreted Zn-dependent insulinase-like peptidase